MAYYNIYLTRTRKKYNEEKIKLNRDVGVGLPFCFEIYFSIFHNINVERFVSLTSISVGSSMGGFVDTNLF